MYWVQIIILIQIIKWMPPYWDNKALPTPTLTLPDTLFSTFWLFPSFFIENKCPSDVMGDKKKSGKRWIQIRVDHVKKTTVYGLPSTPLDLWLDNLL